MKHIKTFESYDHIPEVIRTVEQMLLEIRDFEFSTKVDLQSQKDLIIEIGPKVNSCIKFPSERVLGLNPSE